MLLRNILREFVLYWFHTVFVIFIDRFFFCTRLPQLEKANLIEARKST